jgi:hypothetical protein
MQSADVIFDQHLQIIKDSHLDRIGKKLVIQILSSNSNVEAQKLNRLSVLKTRSMSSTLDIGLPSDAPYILIELKNALEGQLFLAASKVASGSTPNSIPLIGCIDHWTCGGFTHTETLFLIDVVIGLLRELLKNPIFASIVDLIELQLELFTAYADSCIYRWYGYKL